MGPLIQSLAGLRWQDIVDILLTSYILFRLYGLFRGTNVIRMVIAIAMLWILERMAMSIGLIVTSWAMQGIIAAAALIIIIVFRNEIAGVLQTRSLKSSFWGVPQRQIQTPIEIIVESVYELARLKLGALIVLPLKKGIESVVHGGVPWQGKLSREVLLSIFWHGTTIQAGVTIEAPRLSIERFLQTGGIIIGSIKKTGASRICSRKRDHGNRGVRCSNGSPGRKLK